VPYVVVYGEPGARLVDLAVDPHALVNSEGRMRINATYYITRQVGCEGRAWVGGGGRGATTRVVTLGRCSCQWWRCSLFGTACRVRQARSC